MNKVGQYTYNGDVRILSEAKVNVICYFLLQPH